MSRVVSTSLIRAFLERAQDATSDGSTAGAVPSVKAISQRWKEIGLRPGDVALLCLPNGVALLEQFFGVLMAGAVPALAAVSTHSARLRELAKLLGARAVAGPRLNATGIGAQRLENIGPIDVALFDGNSPPAANPGEVVILTSGTSGFASGCVFRIEDLLLNAERHADAIGQRAGDVVLINLPLHFSYALVAQALATLVCGGRLVISGPPFSALNYGHAILRYGVTVSSLTPVLVPSLMHRELPAGLRVLTVGGDTLAPELVGRLLERRLGGELYLTYGLTEAGPRVATLAAHDESPSRYGSVGRPLAGTKVFLREIGDGTGRKQLLVSSDTIMRRRIGFIEGRAFEDFPSPGTIATGDVFEQDTESYLYFQGRLSDFIVRQGEKICVATVRRLASQLPYVVHARTCVVRSGDGGTDYDLTLYPSIQGQDYAVLLRRMLRLAEMPRYIHVEAIDQAHRENYK